MALFRWLILCSCFLLILSCGQDSPKKQIKGPIKSNPNPKTEEKDPQSLIPGIIQIPKFQNLSKVKHKREFRAVWVATVSNINFPSKMGLSVDRQKAELKEIVKVSAHHNLNAIIFQVRPEGDALYESKIEPWSRFFDGTQGQGPGYDPFKFLIQEAKKENIEIHAWINPYRAKSRSSSKAAAGHMSIDFKEYAYKYGSYVWMDPSAKPVQDRVIKVVEDLVARYDLDGIHLDDYFYPYPKGEFPDSKTFSSYQKSGGKLSKADWRRNNVNVMVKRLSEAISKIKGHVRFGISPFGIYRNGVPKGIRGLDQYNAIYADPVHWMQEGYVDYLAPQLYWSSSSKYQNFKTLATWWAGIAQDGRYIFPGLYLSRIEATSGWKPSEILKQVEISRSLEEKDLKGVIYFHIKPLQKDYQKVGSLLKTTFYREKCLSPPLSSFRKTGFQPPFFSNKLVLNHQNPQKIKYWLIYQKLKEKWLLNKILSSQQNDLKSLKLVKGLWAVSAVDLNGIESKGLEFNVR